MTQSHVYVIMGDITHLKCDAWMLPSDSRYHMTGFWTSAVEGLADAVVKSRNFKYSRGRLFSIPVKGWADTEPLPILTAVPLRGFTDAAALRPRIAKFVEVAAEAARARIKASAKGDDGRRNPLLAMPSFGTDGGGGALLKGDVLQAILEQARTSGAKHGVDIVLVLRDERTFALAQVLRQKDPRYWTELAVGGRLDQAKALAERAKAGRLVPFMGAGTSVSAGAPTWKGLIAALARDAKLTSEETARLLEPGMSALDQAGYLRARYEASALEGTGKADAAGPRPSFNARIAEHVALTRYGLAPALLAGLRTEQAITLNYDALFELASADIGDVRTVIPDSKVNGKKWLLKLHGSVTRPETIVLTRDDYLGFNTSRDALSAVVKATLITHHLLFVGFGLKDDHFHEIIHDVRRALPQDADGTGAIATALTLQANPLNDMLWKSQLDLISMGERMPDDSLADAARTLEIFLDALLAFSTDSHSYLLSAEYEHSLGEEDAALRESLLKFYKEARPNGEPTPAWAVVEKAFRDLGHDKR
ncbi:SIR2 family protein [Cryobacterium melibiosiphilum]|uniref:SIR2 family protein n=1 Tax=Cryobacterium melibiosiphilum TaxID=995039 RepID=A0A3A5MIT7_9MICO|nr:SIR2 family protein [Cryobacterium melibiosiphilum]RJT88965.1 SIR2 family protein [Cryobacterium melibiosiphilum]